VKEKTDTKKEAAPAPKKDTEKATEKKGGGGTDKKGKEEAPPPKKGGDDKKGGDEKKSDAKFPSKLYKKGASGRKAVDIRYFKLDGTTLNYFKSESTLKSNKGAKKLTLRALPLKRVKRKKPNTG